jgi:hypothetical protein
MWTLGPSGMGRALPEPAVGFGSNYDNRSWLDRSHAPYFTNRGAPQTT